MSGLNSDGNNAPEKVWVRKFIEAFSEGVANQLALGLLALTGVALSWLWGWYAAGGASNILGYIPANAVVAFDLKTKCPTGWGDFKGAWGRVIVGALEEKQIPEIEKKFLRDEGDKDLKPKPFESVGGYQETVISIPNIPDLIVVSHGDYVKKKEEHTGLESVKFIEGQNLRNPLPNFPPYIALRYCIKLV